MNSTPLTSKNLMPDLRDTFATPRSPWRVSKPLFERAHNKSGPQELRLCKVVEGDREWDMIRKYFLMQAPELGSIPLRIRRIVFCHSKDRMELFERAMLAMERQGGNEAFKASLQGENNIDTREEVMKRFSLQKDKIGTVEIPTERGTKESKTVTVLPLWHGTTPEKARSIVQSGFTSFGKHTFPHGYGSANPNTDVGYFGSGIYFTNSARYANMYAEKRLLLSWVAMRTPFPVIHNGQLSAEPEDMKILKGKGGYKTYNAHYIPVKSIQPQNPHCMIYFPCRKTDTPAWDEFVVFDTSQTCPQFYIELVDHLEIPLKLKYDLGDLEQLMPEENQVPLSPFHAAVISSNYDHVRELLNDPNRRAEVNTPDSDGCTALHLAANQGDAVMIALLIDEGGANPELFNISGFTPLHRASLLGKTEAVKALIARKADPEKQRRDGRTALHICALSDENIDCARHIVSTHPHIIGTLDKRENSALHLAAANNCPKMIEFLVSKGASLNSFSKDGIPLKIAAKRNHVDAINALCLQGANPNAVDFPSPLHTASREGNIEAVEALLSNGARVNHISEVIYSFGTFKETSLHTASREGFSRTVSLLLQHGADVNSSDCEIFMFGKCFDKDYTPLHIAAAEGRTDIVETLTRYRASVNAITHNGYTALHLAANKGYVPIAHILAEHGADLDAQTKLYSWSALYMARNNGHQEMISYLEERGAVSGFFDRITSFPLRLVQSLAKRN